MKDVKRGPGSGLPLTPLQKSILHGIDIGKGVRELAKSTGTSAESIGMELARLQISGYITEDGIPTRKWRDTVEE